jgi:hypothetical protein
MLKFLAVLALAWLALMPPLFTGGDCTREFDAEAARIEADRAKMSTTPQAREYFAQRGAEQRFLSLEQCRRARLRFLGQCGPGSAIYASVPVKNVICRIYRDDAVTVQLHFSEKDRLARLQVDMAPYRTLPLPMLDTAVHWAR